MDCCSAPPSVIEALIALPIPAAAIAPTATLLNVEPKPRPADRPADTASGAMALEIEPLIPLADGMI